MENNYYKHVILYINKHSLFKKLNAYFPIAKKLKACILSHVPASTQQPSAFFNLSKYFIIALLLLGMGVGSVRGATTYTWTGNTSSAWALASNWSPSTGYPGQAANDIAQIGVASFTGSQPTLSVTPANTLASITLGTATNATLTISASYTTGLLTIGTGSTVTESGTITPNFTGGITNNGTFTASTGVHTFSTNAQVLTGTLSIPTATFTGAYTNNGTLTCSTLLTITGVTLTNTGTINSSTSLTGTGTLSNTSGIVNITGGTCGITSLANAGTLAISGTAYTTTTLANFTNTGIINISSTSGTAITGITNSTGGIVNHSGSVTITSFNNSTSTSTLNISTTPTVPTFTTLTVSTAGNTVNYNGTGSQTVKVVAYSNLILSGSGAKTFAVTSVTNNFTLSGTATVSNTAVLTVGGNVYINGGTFTQGSAMTITGNLTLGGGNFTTTSTAATAFTVTGTTTITTGTLSVPASTSNKTFTGLITLNGGTMSGASATLVLGAGISNNSGTVTLTGTTTISTSGSSFSGSNPIAVSTLTVSLPGTVTNNGTVTISTALGGSGTFTNGGSGTLNITGGTCGITSLANAGTLAISGTAYTTTALANFTNTGIINISSTSGTAITGITNSTGGIVNHSGSVTITSFNNSTSTSTLNISTTPTVPTFTTLTVSAVGNTVNYTGTGPQTVRTGTTFYNLGLSGSGTKTMSGVTAITNNFSMSGSATATPVITTIGGSVDIEGTTSMTTGANDVVTGSLTVGTGATLSLGGFSFSIGSTSSISGTVNTVTSATGTKTFTGGVTINSGGVWDLSGQNPATSFGGGITMSGTTFNNGTGAAAFSANQSLLGSIAMIFGGSVTPAGGITLTNSNSGIVTINNIILTGNFTQGSNSPTLSLGNATPFSGAGTFDAGTNTNTVIYTGASATIRVGTYSSLTINGSGTATIGGSTTVNGTMTVSSATTNNSTLTVTTALSGVGTLTQGASSILNIGGTSGISGLNASSNANTVNYTGGAQTVNAVAYKTLGLSGSGAKTMTGVTTIGTDLNMSGSVTATPVINTVGGNVNITGTAAMITGANNTVTGSLTVGTGATLSLGGFSLGIGTTSSISGTVNTVTSAAGTKTFTGAVTINSGGVWDLSGQNPATSFGGGITMSGTTFNNGTGAAAFSANQSLLGANTMTFGGSVTPAASTTLTNSNSGTVTINNIVLAGNFTQGSNSPTLALVNVAPFSGAGTFDASSNINTVNYNGGGTQTIKAVNYSNLGISGGGNSIKTLGGGGTVSGTLTIAASTTLAFGTTAQTLTLSGTGPNTLSNIGTIDMSTNNAAHLLQIAATSIASFGTLTTGTGSTVEYTALGGSQTINPVTYNNLKLDNTSGTNVAGGSITSNGTLATTAGGTLDMGTNALSVGTATHSGTLLTQNTTGTPITTGKTWGGTVNYNGLSGGQTVMAGTYNNLTLSNTGGTETASGNLAVSGTFTTTSGGTLDMGTNQLSGTLSTITNGGTILTQNSTTSPIPSSMTWGGTVTFNGSSVQTIPASNFANLTLNNTAGAGLGGAVNVGGILTLTSGVLTSTTTNLLAVTNTASGAVTGYSSTSYIKGPLRWSLATGISYFFPVSDELSNYRPFELNSITASSPIVQVSVSSSGASTVDATLSSVTTRNWYAQLISGSFTSATVRITESGLASNNVVASTTTAQAGPYTNLGGNSIGGGTISSNAAIPYTGSTYFAIGATPLVALSDNGTQVTAASVAGGTSNVVLHQSALAVTLHDATLTGMTCTTAGTYASADITNLKVWYQTSSIFNSGTASLLSTLTAPGTSGSKTFPSFTSQTITGGTTGYLFITADIAPGATVGNTINLSALTTGNFTFNSATKSGSTSAGGVQTFAVANYYNKSSGASHLETLSNWGTNTDGTGTAPVNFTANNQIFNIYNGTTATIGGAWTVSGTNSKVVLGNVSVAAITYTIPSGYAFTGTIDIAAALSGSNKLSIQNATIPTFGTLNSGSTVDYNGASQAVTGFTYGILNISATGTNTASGTVTATTLNVTSILNMGTNTLNVTTPNNSGTIQTQNTSTTPIPTGLTWGGTVQYNATTGAQTVMAGTYNNLTLSNTSGTQAASNSLTVNGTLTTTSGGTLNMGTYQLLGTLSTITNGGTIQTQNATTTPIPTGLTWGGTVQYNAATGAQTVMAGTYNNLTLSNTNGTQAASNSLTVNGTLTTTSGGTLNMGTYQLLGTLSTITNGGIIQTQNTSATPVPTGLTWDGTIQYNAAAGAQTVMAGTYNSLTLSNTSGTQAASGNLTVSGTLTTTAGGTLNMGTYQLQGTLTTVSNAGIIQTQNTGSTPIPTGKTWGGTVQYNATTGAQTVMAGTYGILTLSNTSGTQTAGGNLTVSGTLTTTTGGTLNMGTYQLLGTPSTVSNGGTIQTQCTSSPSLPTGETWGGTVQYNAATGAQTVMAGTYNNLTLSNTSGTQAASNSLTINGTLTTTSGGTLNMGTYQLSGTLSTIANGGTIQTQNTTTTPTPSGLTWGGTFTFNGSSAQTIPASAFTNLILNNSTGAALGGAVNVGGILTLTSGVLTSTPTNLLAITNTTPGAVTGYSGSSYVNGPLQWSLATGNSYFFPVGDATNYRPFEMNSITCGTPVVRITMSGTGASTVDATLSSVAARNWYAQLISGSFTSATIRITESGLVSTNDIGSSTTQSGPYTNQGGNSIGTTISSNAGIPYTASTYFAVASSPASVVLSDNGTQVTAASIVKGTTNVVLHQSALAVTGANANLTGMTCTTAGTYASTDITNLKVWYQTSSTFNSGTATLLSTLTTPGIAGAKTFPSFTSHSIASGTTGYLFITADIASGAVSGNTINMSALTPGNFTFTSATKSGSTTDGGAQTFYTTYYSRATGNWNVNTTWSFSSGGAAVGNGIYPLTGDIVNIEGGFTVTVTTNAACSTIVFTGGNSNSTTLSINPGITLSVAGTITILRAGGTGTTYVNTLAVGAGILNAGAIAFTTGGASARHLMTISTGTVTVAGDITESGSTTSATITFTDAGTLTLNGALYTNATGILNTVSGSTVVYNASAGQTIQDFTYNNLTLAGSGIKAENAATVNGILSMQGTATMTGTPTYGSNSTLQYMGSASQTTGSEFLSPFSGSGGLIINNVNGVTLNAAKSISSLKLTSGILNTNTYLLSVTGNASSGILGGSATSFINGPVKWTLPASLPTGSTYVFPVGNTSYLPFTLVNPTTGTGTVTAQVQAFNSASGGTADATLDSISHTEYWSLATVGNFTNSSVSLARQTAIIPVLDAVAGSTSLGGTYTALAGTVSTFGVSNSNSIGTDRFFVLAKGQAIITTSTTTLTGFTYPAGNGPSSAQFFSVKGNYLSTNITVLPTDTFEISLSTGSSFAPQSKITLQVLNGTVALDTVYVRMKAGLGVGTIAPVHTISCSSDNAITKTVTCSGTVSSTPTITVTPATLNGFVYNVGSGPSAAQSFTVSGVNLTSNITINAPTDYMICLTTGGTYVASLTLTQSGGNVSLTTIYVKLNSGLPGGSYNENVALTATSAVTQNVVCNGTVSAAIVNVSTFNLGGFIYSQGNGPSGVQTFTVSCSNLTAILRLKAPVNFQISLDNSTYKSSTDSLTITPTSGTINSTIVYVRMAAGLTGVGSPTYGPGNLTAATTGAITQNVACSGQVVPASTPASISSNNTLVGFVYTLGNGPSVVQSFTVSGTALSADITVTPPTNFEICLTSGGTYVTTALTIPQSGGLVNAVSVYVRLVAGLGVATYSGGNITLTSTGATTQNISCNGIVITAPTITAGPSNLGSTCANSTVTFTSSAGSGTSNIYWTGPNNFFSTDANPSISNVTTANNGIYTVTGNALSGVNLLTNGSFESGNTGFGSSYGYVVPSAGALEPENLYTVLNSTSGFPTPASVHNNDGGFSACTPESGNNFMVINGATSPGVIAWSESVSVVPGANYQFSYYVETVNTNNVSPPGNSKLPAKLQLYVNGVPAGQIYTSSETTCSWQQFVYNTNAGSNTVLQLTLIDLNDVANGNDFALDNIVFQQVFSVSASDTLTVNPSLAVSASIAASISPLYSGGSVTFTATPVNGGISPAYQWYVNGAQVGTNSSLFTYTPATGDSIRCKVTSNYPCITGSNPVNSNEMFVTARNNFWLGTNSTDWGTASNWSGGFIPAPGNDVEYATNANNNNHPALRDLRLDQDRTVGSLVNATGKKLIIPAGKELIVNNTISTNNADSIIYIDSSTTGPNGSLIFHNSSGSPVHGSVLMYSKAFYDPNGAVNQKFHWQYFGIPLSSQVADPIFYGSYVRSWDETGTSISNHWVSLNNSSTLLPFYGYEITQLNAIFILFQGSLVNSDFNSGQMSYTSTALYPGQHIYANPYTAAIDIRQLIFGSQTEATVYMYNTGTYNQWKTDSISKTYLGSSPGQYISAPKNTAGNLGIPVQIPSMQGFLIKAMSNDANATFGITYNSVIMKNDSMARAPRLKDVSVTDKVSTLIDLKGTNYGDRMWLFTQPGCTRNFDNGWDGVKILGDAFTPQIYAIEPDGNYQVDAVDDINNTILGFQAGTDTEYTMTFTHNNTATSYSGIYLLDMVENKTVDITLSGSTYSFVSGSTPVPVKRFMIATRNIEKNAPDANTQLKVFSSGHVVFVQNLGSQNGEMVVYDMMGHLLKRTTFGPLGVTAIQLGAIPGAYVVNAATSSERVSKRVILGE